MYFSTRTLASCLVLSIAVLAVGNASADTVQNFSNNSPTTINGDPGAPYPSSIAVSGLSGNISDVTVTFSGLTHVYPGDIDAKLVSPDGRQVMLMSDAGFGSSVSNLTLTFSKDASSTLPTPLTSGTWLPTNIEDFDGSDTFPAPAPPINPGTSLETFNGGDGNGTWKLFVRNDYCNGCEPGVINSWTLSITTQFASCASEGYTGTKLTVCRQVCDMNYTGAKLSALIKTWIALYHTDPPCVAN